MRYLIQLLILLGCVFATSPTAKAEDTFDPSNLRIYLQLKDAANQMFDAGETQLAADIYETLMKAGYEPLRSFYNAVYFYDTMQTLDTQKLESLIAPLLEMDLHASSRPIREAPMFAAFQDNTKLNQLAEMLEAPSNQDQAQKKSNIISADIDNFYTAFDRASTEVSFEGKTKVYVEDYFDKASKGLFDFANSKFKTVEAFVDFVETHRPYYQAIRDSLTNTGPIIEIALAGLKTLQSIYPQSATADVYLLVGRHSSFGTATDAGLLIGVENIIDDDTPVETLPSYRQSVVAPIEALPFIIVHEYVHFNQSLGGDRRLLAGVLIEGGADFLTELAIGSEVYTPPYQTWGDEHEDIVKAAFKADMDGTDWSKWIATSPEHITDEWSRDLGYYVGYKIAKAYYQNAEDKQQAIIDLMQMTDPDAILTASGYLND